MKKFYLILSLLGAFFTSSSYTFLSAQNKDFWFVAPDASEAHDDRPTFFMITTGKVAANVEITLPKEGGGFETKKRFVAENSFWKYDFTTAQQIALIENAYTSSGSVTSKGVHITSDERIFVYYQIDGQRNYQKEIFTLKGENALGNEFYIPFQTVYSVSGQQDAFRQIQIVAAQDGTEVIVEPTGDIDYLTTGTISPSSPLAQRTWILNKGQTLLLREKNKFNANNKDIGLQGSRVYTKNKDHKIAITIFEDCIAAGGGASSVDPIGDQLIPVSSLGRNYIVIKGYSNGSVRDHVYVLAVSDEPTIVTMNGTVVATLAKGKQWSYNMGTVGEARDAALYIQTSQPAYCYQQSAVYTEVGGAIIPSLYSVGARNITFYKPQMGMNVHAMFLIYRKSAKDSFMLDGNKLSLTANLAGVNNSDPDPWVYSKHGLSGSGVTTLKNDEGPFALGYFAGSNTGTALYGYLSDFGQFTLGGDTTRVCGDSHRFDGGYALEYFWKYPGGTSTESSILATVSGKYYAEVNQDPFPIKDSTYLMLQNFKSDLKFPNAAFVGEKKDFSIKLNPDNDINNRYKVKYEWTFSDDASTTSYEVVGINDTIHTARNISWASEGKKTITLKITNLSVGDCSETIVKNIIIHNYPENIDETECYTNPTTTNFKPKQTGGSGRIHGLAQIFVGDIDNDGNLEAVTTDWNDDGYQTSDSILIFGQDLKLKYGIKTDVKMYTNSTTPMALVRIKPTDKYALIIVATYNEGGKYKLRAYRANDQGKGTLVWTSNNGGTGAANEVSIYKDANLSHAAQASVSLVVGDINNDGIPEVLAGDCIFDASNGKLLVTLPGTPNTHGRALRTLNHAQNWTTMPVLADIDNDGQLEVVAGNTTYKITIDPNNAANNKAEVLAQVKIGGVLMEDGFTSVADINMDGQLDVVTIVKGASPSITVWNGVTGDIIAGPKVASVAGGGGSRVFIGDIQGDKHPEMAFSYVSRLAAFEYVPTGATPVDKLKEIWNKKTTDTSGATTLSMFDFDQDGKAELVYRDETHLRIIEGVKGTNRDSLLCGSATHSEYPIIVDFNKDGHADILVSGKTEAYDGYNGIRIAKFSGVDNDWAPSRGVWNQHGYNSVHINDDLTVPKYQLNPGTEFPGEKGKDTPVYPYNGFLLQQTILSKEGTMLTPVADAQLKNSGNISYHYDANTDQLTIKNIIIENVGAAPLNAPVKITVYKDKNNNKEKIGTYEYGSAIPENTEANFNITIEKFGQHIPSKNLILSVNDRGDGTHDQPVCNTCDDNESGAFDDLVLDGVAWIDGGYRKCVTNTALFKSATSLGGSGFTTKWFKPGNPITPWKNTANTEITSLSTADVGQYTFEAENATNKLSVTRVLPHLSVAAKMMSWNVNATDHNWNNINNWSEVNPTTGVLTALKSVPASCTSVHLPAPSQLGVSYPSLVKDADGSQKGSDWELYGQPVADTVTFHYGSELAYPHLLDYKRAQVQYNFGYYGKSTGIPNNSDADKNIEGANAPKMVRNQWYPISAPLKKMVSGDFSFGGYPFTWQGTHNVLSSSGHIESIDFTKQYSQNDVELNSTYNTLGLRVANYNIATGYNNHKPLETLKGILTIPYFEKANEQGLHPSHSYDPISNISSLYYFDSKTLQQLGSPVGKINRGSKNEAYRFIYENDEGKVVIENGTSVYKLKVKPIGGNKRVLIGNPFMSPINMERFYRANSSKLAPNYHVYDSKNDTWKPFPYTVSTNNVNSFEAFVVELAAASGEVELIFPLDGDNALTGAQFSGTIPRRLPTSGALTITASNAEGVGGDYVELNSMYAHEGYTRNISKLISHSGHATPEAFLIDPSGNYYNLYQLYETGTNEVGIGIKCSDTQNELTLNFDQVLGFSDANNIHPILVDKLLGIEQDLTQNSTYKFYQHTTANAQSQYADKKRFAIRFGGEGETIARDRDNLQIVYTNKYLSVTSTIDILQIEVYSLSGQRLFSASAINQASYGQNLPLAAGSYIVKVTTVDKQSNSKKIMAQ